jgi:hypothetical protein
MQDKSHHIILNGGRGEAAVARIVADDPEAGPDYALAEAVGAEEGIVEERRSLDLQRGEAVP